MSKLTIRSIVALGHSDNDIKSIDWRVSRDPTGIDIVDSKDGDTGFTLTWKPELKDANGDWYSPDDITTLYPAVRFTFKDDTTTEWMYNAIE